MEMTKKQITLSDGRTLIYFSFPKPKGGDSEIATQNDSTLNSQLSTLGKGETLIEPKCCCGGEK